jgi:hypothetical protein
MKKRFVATVSILLVSAMLIMQGCVSQRVLEGSERRVAMRKAQITNNQPAIKALKLGEDTVGLGIDVTNLEALKERPFLQIGAALADALIAWGTYEGIKALEEELNDDDKKAQAEINSSADGNINIDIEGSENTTIIVNEQQEEQEEME